MFEFVFGIEWKDFKKLPWWAKVPSLLIALPLRILIRVIKFIISLPWILWGIIYG
jgi:hypothetical protein